MQTWKYGKLRPELDTPFKSVLCMVKDCGQAAFARNICRTHYEQLRTGSALRPVQKTHPCIIEGCADLATKHNLCPAHAYQQESGGAFRPIRRHSDYGMAKCSYGGCSSRATTKGLCSTHYMVTRNGTTGKSLTRNGTPCVICGETRGTQKCHLTPRRDGGTMEPENILPLCPTHHWCLDHEFLSEEEWAVLRAA